MNAPQSFGRDDCFPKASCEHNETLPRETVCIGLHDRLNSVFLILPLRPETVRRNRPRICKLLGSPYQIRSIPELKGNTARHQRTLLFSNRILETIQGNDHRDTRAVSTHCFQSTVHSVSAYSRFPVFHLKQPALAGSVSKNVCTSVAALSNNSKTLKPFVQEKAADDTLEGLPG